VADAAPGQPADAARLALDLDAMLDALADAPPEFGPGAGVHLQLPRPDGSFGSFLVRESPVLSDHLARWNPDFRSYVAHGLDDRRESGRLGITSAGFHALIRSTDGYFRIERPSGELWYRSSRWDRRDDGVLACGVRGDQALRLPDGEPFPYPTISRAGELRRYRLALASTVEFTTRSGGVDTTFAAMTALVNQTNLIFEVDFGIRLILAETAIFSDEPDPFTSGNNQQLIGQAQSVLTDAFGSESFDLGQVLDAPHPTNFGGGLALIRGTCVAEWKAQAVSDGRSLATFMHELAHQFGATHTFNDNATGNSARWFPDSTPLPFMRAQRAVHLLQGPAQQWAQSLRPQIGRLQAAVVGGTQHLRIAPLSDQALGPLTKIGGRTGPLLQRESKGRMKTDQFTHAQPAQRQGHPQTHQRVIDMDGLRGPVQGQHGAEVDLFVGRNEIHATRNREGQITGVALLQCLVLAALLLPRQVGQLALVTGGAMQGQIRIALVQRGHVHGVEGVQIEDRFECLAATSDAVDLRGRFIVQRARIQKQPAAAAQTRQRAMSADVDHATNAEAAAQIPEALAHLLPAAAHWRVTPSLMPGCSLAVSSRGA
jgi:hypothetical protein